MNTTTPATPFIIITQSLKSNDLTSMKHNNSLDDYFRLISSYSGRFLASITNTKQLTLFDMGTYTAVNFSLENTIHIAFSQTQNSFAITTRIPSIKLYQLSFLSQQSTSATLIKEIKPNTFSSMYGWIVWSLDNKFMLYTESDEIYCLNMETKQEQLISTDVTIKSKCVPYYLILDRQNKDLVSSSKTGQICKYSMTIYDPQIASSLTFTPQLTLLQSITLSQSSLTIASLDQSSSHILVSTSRITQQSSFYSAFIISKSNINIFHKINLEQQLIAPPLAIVAQNYENYLLVFLKGEKSLYVYNLNQLQIQDGTLDTHLISNDDSESTSATELKHIKKLDMPYLLHTINYNKISKKLMLGISSQKNEDKIIQINFGFNCSMIYDNSSNQQVKHSCTEQCRLLYNNISDIIFSFEEGQCVRKAQQVVQEEKSCSDLLTTKGYYKWNELSTSCQLQCQNVPHSVSVSTFGTPQQCYCQQNYMWSVKNSQCLALSKADSTNDQPTISPTINSNHTNDDVIPPQDNSSSNEIVVGVVVSIVIVLIVLAIAMLVYVYKYKKLCFKSMPTSYIEDNEMRECDVKSSVSSEQKNREESQKSPSKVYNINDNLHQKIEPVYYEQEIKTESNDNDQDAQVDSERKF